MACLKLQHYPQPELKIISSKKVLTSEKSEKNLRSVYLYGFNGKETDPEGMGGGGATYDYGFRIYNPSLARFLSVDPITSKYPMLTTYQFASNTPIQAIDLDGLEAWTVNDGAGGTTQFYGPFLDQSAAQQGYNDFVSATRGTLLTVSDDGMIQNDQVTSQRIPNLEKGAINQEVSGIILHRTVSSSAESTLSSFENRGIGTHFLIGKDGVIYQTASLDKKTSHLRESQLVDGAPGNSKAIGIEVVGMYNETTKQWDPLTPEQVKASAWLVNSLMQTYNLSTDNVYNHEDIQPKTAGEGATVRNAIDQYLVSPEQNTSDNQENNSNHATSTDTLVSPSPK
jgi:RHS repeat-associated protein